MPLLPTGFGKGVDPSGFEADGTAVALWGSLMDVVSIDMNIDSVQVPGYSSERPADE